jgi:hypothetical protein
MMRSNFWDKADSFLNCWLEQAQLLGLGNLGFFFLDLVQLGQQVGDL